MRHAILGPGGIGGFVGAILSNAGEDVTVIVRPGADKSYPKLLSLDSPFGTIAGAKVSVRSLLATSLDVLWVTVKATQLDAALGQIGKEARFRAVVPLLNGVDHVARLRARFGKEIVFPATIAVEAERTAPGKVIQRSPFARINVAASGKPVLESSIALLRRFGCECNFVEGEATLLWTKLAILAPLALSTTAAQAPMGEVLKDPKRAALLEACLREACAVGNAEGASLDPETVLKFVRGVQPGMRSSMQKDLAAGNPLELDAIGGPIVRGGSRLGIATPATTQLISAVSANVAARK